MAALGVSGLALAVLVPCRGRFMWPLDVDGAFWRYLLMAVVVSPSHLLSWLLCTAWSNVGVGGLNKLWWRYWTLAFAVGIVYALLA